MTSGTTWPEPRELEALCSWLALQYPMPRLKQDTLRAVGRLSELARPARPSASTTTTLRRQIDRWGARHHGSLVLFHDAAYPALLREIARPPVALFVEGDVGALQRDAVAIVGSRAATMDYVTWTRDMAADLVRAGVVVASGLARGIDAAAHRGALDARGVTLAVLGTGTDVVYPPENVELQRDIVRHGCVVSELPPGTPPQAWHFPCRNRILAGLSRAVVVVQAERRSGALVTAKQALAENRDVMAVPGCVTDPRSAGTHALLRQGAAPVASAPEVLEALHGLYGEEHGRATPSGALLEQLHRPSDVETLRRKLGWDVAKLQRILAELELAGWIEQETNGRVRRVVERPA